MKARSNAHIPAHAHGRQTSISRLSYFCREHYLGSVGRVPAFSSVSSGRHCTAAVIQTHLFPLSPAPHPFHPTSCSIVGAFCLSVCVSPQHSHKVICFSTGSNHSARWKHLLAGWKEWLVWDHRAPLCPANLEVKRRAGVSNKVPPHSLYMPLHWKSSSATPYLLLTSLFSFSSPPFFFSQTEHP